LGSYVPSFSGVQTLSINFSRIRGFGGVGNTPTDVIDNISLLPVPVPLNIQSSGNNVILSWTNSALALQAAPTAGGTYANIPGAISPNTNAISGSQRYFRLKAS
jgi:hypothetical protein